MEVTSTGTVAPNTREYVRVSGAPIVRTLEAIPTGVEEPNSWVVVADVNCSETNYVRIQPASGDRLREDLAIDEPLDLDYPGAWAAGGAIVGSDDWGLQLQATTLATPAGDDIPGTVSYENRGSFTCYLKNPAGGDFDSGTAYWERIGKIVVLTLPALTIVNTNTGFSLSTSNGSAVNTWPSDITPARNQNMVGSIVEGATFQTSLFVLTNTGDFRIYKDLAGNAFSSSSAEKGVPTTLTLTYMVS